MSDDRPAARVDLAEAGPGPATPDSGPAGPAAGRRPDLDRGASLPSLADPKHPQPLHAVRPAVPPRPEDAAGFARVLARKDFRYLWLAQCASQLAQNTVFVFLLIVIFQTTHKASLSAVVTVLFTLPGVLLSAPAGVFADRHDKRSLMLVTNLGRALLLLLAGLSFLLPGIATQAWPLLLVTFLFSASGQLFAPAEAASIPSLVSREQIQGATSLFMTTVILTIVLGAVLGSLSYGLLGESIPLYAAAGLFGLAAFLIWRIGASLHAVPAGTVPTTHVLRDLHEGLAILGDSMALRWGMIQLGLALIVVFTVYTLGPAYMSALLGPRGDQETYVVLVPATIGLVAMAGVLGQHLVVMSRRALMVAAFITGGACLVAIGVAPPLFHRLGVSGLVLPLVVALALVFGLALGAILIPAFTILQEGTTEESRGRIFGGVFTVINAAIAVPALVAGALADWLSVDSVATAVGVGVVATGVCFRLLLWGSLAGLDTAAISGGGSDRR